MEKATKELNDSGAYTKLMSEYGSFTYNVKNTGVNKTYRKGMNGTNVSWGEAIVDMLNHNIVRDFGEKMYYKIVDALFLKRAQSKFLTNFKRITGNDFDSYAYMNNLEYEAMNEYDIWKAISLLRK